jgi:CheY-like chemotaxis protein
MQSSAAQDMDGQPAGQASKRRILVVDDNIDAANSLGRLLSLHGNEIRVVHSGAAALAEIVRFHPRVVLLDLGMPIMDGFETAEQIHARFADRDIDLIAITGWGQERDRQQTEAAGFTAHLIKPVNFDQLEAILHRIMTSEPSPATRGTRTSPA